MRALIADDDMTLRRLMRLALEGDGWHVDEAEDGQQACEMGATTEYGLIVLDIQMPHIDGLAVCRQLRADPRHAHVPILISTGRDDLQAIERALDAGASDFLRKPLNLALFMARIRFAVKAAAALGDLAQHRKLLDEAQTIARLGRWTYSPETTTIHFCPNAVDIFGLSTDQMSLQTFMAHVPDDDRDILMAAFYAMRSSKPTFGMDHRFDSPKGSRLVIHVRAAAEWHADGSLRRIYGSAQDVTERHTYAETTRLWSRVIERTGEGMLIVDGRYRILQVNRAFARISGHVAADLVGQPIDVLDHILGSFRQIAQIGENWRGELGGRSLDGKPLSLWVNLDVLRDSSGNIGHLVVMVSDISALKRSQSRLDYLARHDPLTGLPNRHGLVETLEAAIKRPHADGDYTAVLYIDLDRFKNVNDSMGHSFGDRLLKLLVERIATRLPDHATLGRLGGDEFMLVLQQLRDPALASRLASDVIEQLRQPFRIEHYEFTIGASIGICIYPDHGQSVDTLVKNADTAMYRAKDLGRNRYEVYAEQMSAGVLARVALEADLRHALKRHELELYFQPKINLLTRQIIGAEALLRWRHPVHGMVSPAQFIPIAEETGLIADLGQWVIEDAARKIARWCQPPFNLDHIAVNVSGPQIWRHDFLDHLSATIEQQQLSAQRLQIEITETLVMKEVTQDETVPRLDALRQLGIAIAIDDFGTGHSSLAYLKRLPVSVLKIDQSFVRDLGVDPNDAAITRAIIALAQSLQLDVVAEGIETEEQWRWLTASGCTTGQGYFFARPMPAAAFEAVMLEHLRLPVGLVDVATTSPKASEPDTVPQLIPLPRSTPVSGKPTTPVTAPAQTAAPVR